MLMFVCRLNEGDGSGNRCVKEGERKISFSFGLLNLTSLTSSVNRLNGSGDRDVKADLHK